MHRPLWWEPGLRLLWVWAKHQWGPWKKVGYLQVDLDLIISFLTIMTMYHNLHRFLDIFVIYIWYRWIVWWKPGSAWTGRRSRLIQNQLFLHSSAGFFHAHHHSNHNSYDKIIYEWTQLMFGASTSELLQFWCSGNHFRPHNVDIWHFDSHFWPLEIFSEGKKTMKFIVCFFPLDILQWWFLLKNVDEQVTPMCALPFRLQTTLFTHSSGTLHEQETWLYSASPTEQLQVTVLWL